MTDDRSIGSDFVFDVEETPSGPKFVKREARHEDTCLSKERVQGIRERVYGNLIVSMLKSGMKSWPVSHLWFPRDTVNAYELRSGNPPSDSDRPKHMRGYNLVVHIQDYVVEGFRKQYEQLTNEGSESELHHPFAQRYVIPGLEKAAQR